MKEVVLAVALMALLPTVAIAQETTTTLDLSGIANLAIEYLAAAVLALGGFLITRGLGYLGLQNDAAKRAVIEAGLERALGYAVGQIRDLSERHSKFEVRNEIVGLAGNYAQEYIPGALKHFNITPETLRQMIEARLQPEHIDSAVGPAAVGNQVADAQG